MISYQVVRKSLGLFPILNLSKSLKWEFPWGQNITKFTQFTFSGGEEHIKIDKEDGPLIESADNMLLIGDTTSSSGIMKTVLATDAIRSINPKIKISLFAPYFPYARQDRRMVYGEPLSVKCMANIINMQSYDTVELFDPHSDVCTALLDNVSIITNKHLVNNVYNRIVQKHGLDKVCIVSPDAGAEKKVFGLAKELNFTNIEIVCCTKRRDVSNGKILGSVVPDYHNLRDKVCLLMISLMVGTLS
jgi:ribose-phosphate pyrophosphokinase